MTKRTGVFYYRKWQRSLTSEIKPILSIQLAWTCSLVLSSSMKGDTILLVDRIHHGFCSSEILPSEVINFVTSELPQSSDASDISSSLILIDISYPSTSY